MWVLYFLSFLVIIHILIARLFYHKRFGHRIECSEEKMLEVALKYPQLKYVSIKVKSGISVLNCSMYYHSELRKADELVIIVHGYGNTHVDYMDEIYYFCRMGYDVLECV